MTNPDDLPMTPRAVLQYVLYVCLKRKYLILFYFFFTTAALLAATYLFTPMWYASCRLLIQANPAQQMIVFDEIEVPSRADASSFAPDLVEMLISEEFAGRIVEEFELDELARRKAQEPENLRERVKLAIGKTITSPVLLAQWLGILPNTPKDFFADAVDDFVEHWVDTELVEGTSTINLAIYADTPERAIAIANRMKEMLLERVRSFEQSEAIQTYNFVRDHLDSVRESLEGAESELLTFMEREGIADFETQRSQILTKQDKVSNDLDTNRISLAGTQAKLEELERQISPPKFVETGASLDLSANGQDTYARYRNSMSEQDTEQSMLATLTLLSELSAQKAILESDLKELDQEVSEIAAREMELGRLQRSVAALNDRYTTMHERFLELEVQKFTQTPEYDVQVLAEPYIPRGWDADWPDWFLAILVAVGSGACVAPGIAFFLEYWLDPVQSPSQIAEMLPVIGVVPRYSVRSLHHQFGKLSPPAAPVSASSAS